MAASKRSAAEADNTQYEVSYLFCANKNCGIDVQDESYFELKPCGCVLCPGCFGIMHGEQVLHVPRCLGCCTDVTSHESTSFCWTHGRRSKALHTLKAPYRASEFMSGFDAMDRYLSSDPDNQEKEFAVLVACRQPSPTNDGMAMEALSYTVDIDGGTTGRLPDDTEDRVIETFGILGQVVVGPDTIAGNEDVARHRFADTESGLTAIADRDSSLLTRSVVALMQLAGETTKRSTRMAFVAAEMIRSAASKAPGPLQRSMGFMHGSLSPSKFLKFMSTFGISIAGETNRQTEIKNFASKFEKGIRLERHQQVCISADNLDATIGGAHVRMFQTTTRSLSANSREKLFKDGLYASSGVATSSSGGGGSSDGGGGSSSRQSRGDRSRGRRRARSTNGGSSSSSVTPVLSRDRKKWEGKGGEKERIIKAGGGKSLLPTEKHYNPMAKLRYKMMHNVLSKMESFPDPDELCKAADDRAFFSFANTEIGDLGAQRLVAFTDTERNLYILNGISPDVSLPYNLSSNEGLIELMKYCMRMWHDVMEAPIDGSEDVAGPIMENGYVYLLLDGQPASRAIDMIQKDPEKWCRLRVISGGLHVLINVHRGRGNVVGDLRLKDLCFQYLDSDNKVRWIVQPPDPGQANEDTIGYLYAHYYAMCIGYIRSVGRSVDFSTPEAAADAFKNVSVVDVHDFVLKLCLEEHSTVIADFDLGWALVILLMMDTKNNGEGEGDWDLYLDLNRVLMLLYVLDNKTGYIKIDCEVIKMEHVDSEADKKVIQNQCWTGKTPCGGLEWRDCIQEWQQRDTKQGASIGRTAGHGLDDRIDRLQMNLVEYASAKYQVQGSTSYDRRRRVINSQRKSDRPFAMGRSFVAVFAALHRQNTHRSRVPDGVTMILPGKGEDVSSEPMGMRTPTGAKSIHSKALFLLSEARDRAAAVYDNRLLETTKTPAVTSKIDCILESMDEAKTAFMKCYSTFDEKELLNRKVCRLSTRKHCKTKVFLEPEYNWCRDNMPQSKRKNQPKLQGNEDLVWVAKKVCEMRKHISEKRKGKWQSKLKQAEEKFLEDNQEYSDDVDQDKLATQMQDPFFYGSEEARSFYKKKDMLVRVDITRYDEDADGGNRDAAAGSTAAPTPRTPSRFRSGWTPPDSTPSIVYSAEPVQVVSSKRRKT